MGTRKRSRSADIAQQETPINTLHNTNPESQDRRPNPLLRMRQLEEAIARVRAAERRLPAPQGRQRVREPQKRPRSASSKIRMPVKQGEQKAARHSPAESTVFKGSKRLPPGVESDSRKLARDESSHMSVESVVPIIQPIREMFEEEFKEEADFMKFDEFQAWLKHDFPEVNILILAQNSDQLMGAFEQYYRHVTEKDAEGDWGSRQMPLVGFPTINKEGAAKLRISDEFQSPSGLNVSPKVNVLFTDHFNKGFTVINGRVVKQYDLPDGSVYFKIDSPLGKFTAHESQITYRVLEEEESIAEEFTKTPSESQERQPKEVHDRKAVIVKKEIRSLIDQEGMNTVDLAANFDVLIEKYNLLYMRFAGLGTSSARVIFGINPDYEVKLTGTQVEMRMAGTDVPGTSSKRTTDNAPAIDKGRFNTRVKWLGDDLTINGQTDRVGKAMHAFPISQDHQKGSDTSANTTVQKDIMGQMPTGTAIKGKENRYIKGHLLNANIGGPASAENLFPITDKANGQHLNTVEAYIKTAVDAGYVCEYKLEVKNISTPTANSVGLYTVDADFEFDFTRLDTSLKQIPKTRHTGVIHSRYGNKPAAGYNSGLSDSSKDRKTEFKHDYKGGSVNKPQDPSGSTATAGTLKMSNRLDAAQTVGATPGGKGVPAQIGDAPSGGFTHAFPPNITTQTLTAPAVTTTAVPNLGTISLGSVPVTGGAQTLASPIPAPTTTSGRLSLFKSTATDVENYLGAAVNGWNTADIKKWVSDLRKTTHGKWDDILKHVPPTNLNTSVAVALLDHMKKTVGITIKGNP